MKSTIRTAVLASGGIDSAILMAERLRLGREVTPVYVKGGLVWEAEERAALASFLEASQHPNLHALVELEVPLRTLYGEEHWSISGRDVPDARSDWADVYLPGRNLILLALAATYAATAGIEEIALGVVGGNPFQDATPEFLDKMSDVSSAALESSLRIVAPFRNLQKKDLIKAYADLPLHLTFSCADPKKGRHCGICTKCFERHRVFEWAEVPDPTRYAARALGISG